MTTYSILATSSYLLGSIPFGYLLVRFFTGEDVRISGSGNIGATNVARKSRALGVATLVLDAAKGVAAVLLTQVLISGTHPDRPRQELMMTVAAFFAVVGHMYPLWLKFQGGKGVATSLGAFLLLTPRTILCMIFLFLILAVAFRFVSLGSVAVAAAFPLVAWALREYSDSRQLAFMALVALLVIWKHGPNIRRLATGTEARFGAQSAPSPSRETGSFRDTLR